ncbi:hypothetical protein SAMN05720382_1019 [Polaromonas sp. JS666]|nr:hypothetical protein SAMN05720382_1019 [Polaromonas sp. JS666]
MKVSIFISPVRPYSAGHPSPFSARRAWHGWQTRSLARPGAKRQYDPTGHHAGRTQQDRRSSPSPGRAPRRAWPARAGRGSPGPRSTHQARHGGGQFLPRNATARGEAAAPLHVPATGCVRAEFRRTARPSIAQTPRRRPASWPGSWMRFHRLPTQCAPPGVAPARARPAGRYKAGGRVGGPLPREQTDSLHPAVPATRRAFAPAAANPTRHPRQTALRWEAGARRRQRALNERRHHRSTTSP